VPGAGRRGLQLLAADGVQEHSIGSLYQYFPSKLALAEAIRQRHLDAVLAALEVSDRRDDSDGPDRGVEQLIDGVIAVHAVDPRVHEGLLEDVPLASRSGLESFEEEYRRTYVAFIAANSAGPDRARDAVAGRVLAAAVEGVVHAAVRQGELKSATLRLELAHLVR